MGATKIMVVRHAEKPGEYGGIAYDGIDAAGKRDPQSLVTIGWARAGALATLFAPFYGAILPDALGTPTCLFAADPNKKDDDEASQRPVQTIAALADKLGFKIDTRYAKSHYAKMVGATLECSGVVLISWQHQNIPAIGDEILRQTGTKGIALPASWPGERYDLVWVFGRPSGNGPITAFAQVPQMLLAGDKNSVIKS